MGKIKTSIIKISLVYDENFSAKDGFVILLNIGENKDQMHFHSPFQCVHATYPEVCIGQNWYMCMCKNDWWWSWQT